MSPKEIKKLADACRKAGIKSFKNSEVEFTLSDTIPFAQPNTRRVRKATVSDVLEQPDVVINDETTLSDEDILFWSSPQTEENQ